MNQPPFRQPPLRQPAGLIADYMRVDPVTGRVWVDAVGYTLEQLRMTPERSSEAARQIAAAVPRGVRPLEGLQPNQLGQSVLFRPGEVLTPKPVFRVAPKGDAAELLTVVLGLDPAEAAAADDEDAFFQATIHWGTGGASFVATVDVMRGTQLSICASFLEVSAVRLPPGVTGDEGTPCSWRLSAAVGYASAGRPSAPARFTDRLGVLPTNTGAESKIPNFATSFAVTGKNLAGNAFDIGLRVRRDLSDGTQEQAYEYQTINNTGLQAETTFPVGGPARFVDAFNKTGDDAFVEIIYALAL